MKDIKDILFTVHARLNSTRVPQKMIRSFSGKSLIEIAIEKLLSTVYILALMTIRSTSFFPKL